MKPLSEHLTVLIATAEDIMRRPARDMPTQLPPAFTELAAAIRYADAKPAESVRATRSGVIMVNAIEGFFEHGNDRWQMLIGATLPVLRHEAWQALRNERAASEESRR